MPPDYAVVRAKLDAIEAEMKRGRFWQAAPLKPEQYHFTRAFALDTMALAQWLRFIFVPRVRAIIDQRGQFPAQSMVGAQAAREFDGVAEANELVRLLSEFDALFDYNLGTCLRGCDLEP